MILRNAPFAQFGPYIRQNNKKLVLFGAGTLLTGWVQYLLEQYKITENVVNIIDNSLSKQGRRININGGQFIIDAPEKMITKITENTVILITGSYFAAMIEQLDQIRELDQTECYIAPIMHITDKKQEHADIRNFMEQQQNIPKVIHYCWFGKKPLPERNQKYMESRKRYCSDYEIVEWNETNYDVHKNQYMGQAYDAGKYGYVPDYARIDILHEHGGIYLDTDVELIRNIDELLYLQAFTSFEEYPTVNFGGGSGSIKGNPLLKSILAFREKASFVHPDGSYNTTTCGYFETVPLQRAGLKPDGTIQNINGLTVLSSEYFHPKSSITGMTDVTENTYAIHQFSWSWVDEEQMKEKKKTHEEYVAILRRMQEHKGDRE